MKTLIVILLLPILSYCQAKIVLPLNYTVTKGAASAPAWGFVDATYQANTNHLKTGTVYTSLDGTNAFCGYSTNYFLFGDSARYYVDYASTDDAYNFISISGSVASSCEAFWDADVSVGVIESGADFFYRTYDQVDAFVTSAILALPGDKYGLFMSNSGVIKAQYYRAGVWIEIKEFDYTASGDMYPSYTGTAGRTITNPKFSNNIQ